MSGARAWLESASPIPPDGLTRVLAHQRADGSWGEADDARRRVLPTLWTLSTLSDVEAGDASGAQQGSRERHTSSSSGRAGEHGATTRLAWPAAVGFLAEHATAADGVFSRDGTPSGVLSCYVAIAATTYMRCGRDDLAAPQIDWIVRHQDVREHGRSPRGNLPLYQPGLATRYGGCLASTSCLVGVVKAGRALARWRSDRPASAPVVDELLGLIRSSLLARSLVFRSDGEILPLGTPPTRAREWLAPTFPLDWRTDLVEVLDLVTHTGDPDERMQPALDLLAAAQHPSGAWPLARAYWPPGFPALEPRSVRSPSRLATSRVLHALAPLTDEAR